MVGHVIDAQSATANYQMSIGNLLFSQGIDGTGTTVSTGNLGVGVVAPSSRLDVDGTVETKVYTVAGLPAATTAGQMAFVSDASVAHAGNSGTVVAGSGANFVPVYSDGTDWRIH